MYVLYNQPKDYPDQAVVRQFDLHKGSFFPTTKVALFPTVKEALDKFVVPGAAFLDRFPEDDPCIVGCWI